MGESSTPIVLFDGICNYCNSMVNFIIRQDKKKLFRFAALQSPAAQQLLQQYGLPQKEFNSFVLVDNGKVYLRSTAILRVLQKLPWYWQWAQLFQIIPKPICNAVYNRIARNRYKWFGKKEACMVPTPEVRSRFL